MRQTKGGYYSIEELENAEREAKAAGYNTLAEFENALEAEYEAALEADQVTMRVEEAALRAEAVEAEEEALRAEAEAAAESVQEENNANSLKFDLSKAGQCNMLTINLYFSFPQASVILVSFSFGDKNNMRIPLKGDKSGKNSLHCVLLHRPSKDIKEWKIIDSTYIGNTPVDFPKYMYELSKFYDGEIDFINIKWEIHGRGINRWVGSPGNLQIEWSEIMSNL